MFRGRIELKDAPEGGLLERLGGRVTGRAPLEALAARAWNAVVGGEPGAVERVSREAGVNLASECAPTWLELLERLIEAAAEDGVGSAEERAFVTAYVRACRVGRVAAEGANARAVTRALERRAHDLLRAWAPGANARAEMEALARRLRVPDDEAAGVVSRAFGAAVDERVARALDDGLVSDAEYDGLRAFLADNGVTLTNEADVEQALALARERWRVLHGTPLTLATGLRLKRGEEAWFDGDAEWHELRKVRAPAAGFAGVTGRVRLARGVSFRYGAIGVHRPSADVMTRIDEGRLVLTTRRVLFMGAKGNKSVEWSRVLAVTVHAPETVEFEKATGKTPVVTATSSALCDPRLLSAFAQRLVALEG